MALRLAVGLVAFSVVAGSADAAHAQTVDGPLCIARAGTPPSIALAATKREGRLALIVRCSRPVISVGVSKPPFKMFRLRRKVQIAGGSAGNSMTCSPAGGTCQGSVAANAAMRITAVYRKRVCRKPRLRLTIGVEFEPRACPGPAPCPLDVPTARVRTKGFSGC
jgi:hypothetical protein